MDNAGPRHLVLQCGGCELVTSLDRHRHMKFIMLTDELFDGLTPKVESLPQLP